MGIAEVLRNNRLVLSEAAVVEPLRRSPHVSLHPRLVNALLIYDEKQKTLSGLYEEFIGIARAADVPITICAPTWRANRERLLEAGINADVNGDAVRFMKKLRSEAGTYSGNVLVGGLAGCKNDCYRPEESLASGAAREFHSWQVSRLAKAEPDFLLAATMPAVEEAAGMALAMADSGVPYFISFVINRNGRVLDGSSLEQAFELVDNAGDVPPLGYWINCTYPSFFDVRRQPEAVLSRLAGFQANSSSLDHTELDGSTSLKADDISDWGDRMIELNRRYGVTILGGCCGTTTAHLRYLVRHLC